MTEENLNTPASPVIVGIDGSERDATCIAWGAGAAMRTGRPMVLVHALNLTAELVAPDLIGGSVPAMDGGTDTLLQAALARAGGNISETARLLGLTRSGLRYRLEKHGLEPGSPAA